MLLEQAPARPPMDHTLEEIIAKTKDSISRVRLLIGPKVAKYVHAVSISLQRAHVPLSNRRKKILFENILALIALKEDDSIRSNCYTALRNSIPQRAQREVPERITLQAHRNAQAIIEDEWDDVRIALLQESDPIRRIYIALCSNNADLSCSIILDAWSGLSDAERLPTAFQLFKILSTHYDHLPAVLFETLLPSVIEIESLESSNKLVRTNSPQYKTADAIARLSAKLDPLKQWISDCLWAAYRKDLTFDPDALANFAMHVQRSQNAFMETQYRQAENA